MEALAWIVLGCAAGQFILTLATGDSRNPAVLALAVVSGLAALALALVVVL